MTPRSLLSPDESWDGSVEGSNTMIGHAKIIGGGGAKGSAAAVNLDRSKIGDAIGAYWRAESPEVTGNEVLTPKEEVGGRRAVVARTGPLFGEVPCHPNDRRTMG